MSNAQFKMRVPLAYLPLLQEDIKVISSKRVDCSFQYKELWDSDLKDRYSELNASAHAILMDYENVEDIEFVIPQGALYDVIVESDYATMFYFGVELDCDMHPLSDIIKTTLLEYDPVAFSKLAETL